MSVEACLLVNSIAIILLGLAVIKNTFIIKRQANVISEQENLLWMSIPDIDEARRIIEKENRDLGYW